MRSTGGQMAIFVALIFQVLFVFFAMIINIGLTVHDKINLQNSVDLATYYAAGKQAEILNALAHINYQIRQDYKLLAFRQRVIGGFGYKQHPGRLDYNGPLDEELSNTPMGEGSPNLLAEQPAICITHTMWQDFMSGSDDDSLCRSALNKISELPKSPVIASFNPLNAVISSLIESIREGIKKNCDNGAAANWFFAAMANYAYRVDVGKRKEAFKKVAALLAADRNDFKDLDGQSVKEGALKTFKKNLTAGNRAAFEAAGEKPFNIFNSLGSGAENNGLPKWLAEIPIQPMILYVFHKGTAGSCTNYVKSLGDTGELPNNVNAVDPQGALRAYIPEPENPTHKFHSSRGFEKNPWYMAYVGVIAATKPQKSFAPFSSPTVMTARAFAKPFGGTIGPWETNRWQPGSSSSDSTGKAVDPLAVPRMDRFQPTGNLAQDLILVPNFSKYPGDKFGLKSNLALAFGKFNLNQSQQLTRPSTAQYAGQISKMNTPEGDPVAFSPQTDVLRRVELAAIAPDIFDMLYYSIEPQFARLYMRPFTQTLGLVPDLGVANNMGTIFAHISIAQDQAMNGNNKFFYKAEAPPHVLTSWAQASEGDYSFPKTFMDCQTAPTQNTPAAPGNCILGGRTGYSVKFVGWEYLNSEAHNLGGEGVSANAILNPPPEALAQALKF